MLNLLLKYITTHLHIPPTGISKKISVEFLPQGKALPDANSCFNKILLPVTYTCSEDFNKALMTSLRHASCSFASGH